MRQVVDTNGNKIAGLYRKDDGSLINIDPNGLTKCRIAKKNFNDINNEVVALRAQLNIIMELLNKNKELLCQ